MFGHLIKVNPQNTPQREWEPGKLPDRNSKIAAGAVVLDEVPPDSTAVGVPARVVRRGGKRVDNFDNVHIVDPYAQEDCKLQCQIDKLKKRIDDLTLRLDAQDASEKPGNRDTDT